MKSIEENRAFYTRLMDMLEAQLSKNDEIVLHDLTHGYEHTIVDIRNGQITGRKVGDCGTNVGLEVMRGQNENGDRYCYITHTKDGKILRSSTMYLRDDDGKIIGSLCMNKDITETIKLETYFRNENKLNGFSAEKEIPAKEKGVEVFPNTINELLEQMIEMAQKEIAKPVSQMSREDKIAFVLYLDQKGVFLISKSGPRVCEYLGISKFTLYNYLGSGHKAEEP